MIILYRAKLTDIDRALVVLNGALLKKRSHGDEAWGSGIFTVDEMLPDVELGNLYIAQDDSEVVGSVVLQEIDEKVWDSAGSDGTALYIHKFASIKKGVGADIIKQIEKLALHKNKSYLRLDCSFKNAGLYNYYIDHGFIEVRRSAELSRTSVLLQKDLHL
jgi:hypothetical protein